MKKKFVAALAVLLFGSMVLVSCGSVIGSGLTGVSDGPITLNMTGKEAAELLLSQTRLDEAKLNGGIGFMPHTGDALSAKMQPSFDFLTTADTSATIQSLSLQNLSSLQEWLDNDGFEMDGSMWMWNDLPAYSNDASFYESYVRSITTQAAVYAELIHMIKTRINITDKWIIMAEDQRILLTVSESSETIYQRFGNGLSICYHYVDDSGRDVYEMYSEETHENNDHVEQYVKYIEGEYYEYCLDYTPGDGDHTRWYCPRVIVEKTKGYWNMLCMTDVHNPEEEGGRFFNIGNLVATDEVVYQFQTMLHEGQTIEECEFSYSIISPDMKTDILSFNLNLGEIWLSLNGFSGVDRVQIDYDHRGNSYAEVIYGFGDDRPVYMGNGQAVEVVLSDGGIIRSGDTFADGDLFYDFTSIHADLGIPVYFAEMRLLPVDRETMTVDRIIHSVAQMLAECGLEPACDLGVVEKSMSNAIAFSQRFGQICTWNGQYVNSLQELKAADQILKDRYASYGDMHEAVKDLPAVDLNDHLDPLPEKLDFADFSGYSYGKITVQDGVIRAEEMIASLPDHVLLDDGSEYVLRLGLRKYLDGGTPSEVIVVLHGDTESYVTHEGENAMAFTQGANYTIPTNLSEGRYLLVAFVATADEGIRVSRTVPLASVDFESGSVESEVAEITYEKVEDNMLVVTSRSKLYTEVVLAGDLPLTAASVLEQLTVKAMGSGIPAEDAVLELYDSECGQGTALAEGSPLVAGIYRLKYRTTSGGGADAFVYCVVTEEMLIPSA